MVTVEELRDRQPAYWASIELLKAADRRQVSATGPFRFLTHDDGFRFDVSDLCWLLESEGLLKVGEPCHVPGLDGYWWVVLTRAGRGAVELSWRLLEQAGVYGD